MVRLGLLITAGHQDPLAVRRQLRVEVRLLAATERLPVPAEGEPDVFTFAAMFDQCVQIVSGELAWVSCRDCPEDRSRA